MSEIRSAAVIGLGLVGGSIARELAARGIRVLGYDTDADTLQEARRAGVVSSPLAADLAGAASAEVVFIATPVDVSTDVLRRLSPHVGAVRLVTDVGSTKAAVVQEAERLGLGPRFVGAHPLAGDERSGWAASRSGLFRQAQVYLCPAPSSSADALDLARQIWASFGGRPEIVQPAEHDHLLAWTSHLPQLASTALALALAREHVAPDALGPGGRGMVRLARSSPEMWAGIALTNAPALEGALSGLRQALDRVADVLAAGRGDTWRALFAEARAWTEGPTTMAAAGMPAGRAADAAAGAPPAPDAATRSVPESDTARRMVPDGEAAGDPPRRVAFQGEMGAYSEEAVAAFFSRGTLPVPYREFREVGEAVAKGETDLGLLPVENTVAGSVIGAYEVLARPELEVVGEIVRPIRHRLLGPAGSYLANVRRVLSHPVALAQCSRFLAERPWLEAVAYYDTAGAAREVAEAADPGVAAIAGEGAAARYGLEMLAADIQDRPDNRTRFLVVRRRAAEGAREGAEPAAAPREARGAPQPEPAPAAAGKSALLIETPNRPGALVEVLRTFAHRRVNLSHIQSMPGEAAWTYRFFVELEADAWSGPAAEAVAEAREGGATVRILGSFAPASVEEGPRA